MKEYHVGSLGERRISCHPVNINAKMIRKILDDKPTKLFIFFTAFFVANALIAECIGGKIFSLETTLGLNLFHLPSLAKRECLFNNLWCVIVATGVCDDRCGE